VTTDFWDTIDRITASTEHAIASALVAELARLPIPRVARFHDSLISAANEALTWELWKAADIIHRAPTSQDGFCYFRLWLVGQGSKVFASAVRDPDSLATHPWIIRLASQKDWADENYPWAESLMYTSENAYEQIMAKLGPEAAAQVEYPEELDRRPSEVPNKPEQWRWNDEPEIRRRFPNLVSLFDSVGA
jgi:hypothetical protein